MTHSLWRRFFLFWTFIWPIVSSTDANQPTFTQIKEIYNKAGCQSTGEFTICGPNTHYNTSSKLCVVSACSANFTTTNAAAGGAGTASGSTFTFSCDTGTASGVATLPTEDNCNDLDGWNFNLDACVECNDLEPWGCTEANCNDLDGWNFSNDQCVPTADKCNASYTQDYTRYNFNEYYVGCVPSLTANNCNALNGYNFHQITGYCESCKEDYHPPVVHYICGLQHSCIVPRRI